MNTIHSSMMIKNVLAYKVPFPGVLLSLLLAVFVFIIILTEPSGKKHFENIVHRQDDLPILVIDTERVLHVVDEKFLSIALDTTFLLNSFKRLNKRQWKTFQKLARTLSPAYLRLGGTRADQIYFTKDPQDNGNIKKIDQFSQDECKYLGYDCEDVYIPPNKHIYLSSYDWMKLNQFTNLSNLSFIYDLNVLPRTGDQWNYTNAQELISFSAQRKYPLDWQLGNEPNFFQHVFNTSISPSQLSHDYKTLRKILNEFEIYKNSKLIGPEVTRPVTKELSMPSVKYLRQFLKDPASDSVDVISFHQYYLNGRTASLVDFLNVDIFELLDTQIQELQSIVNHTSRGLKRPIWLTETSTAYGGGAPGLSDSYVASFLWLDKLGLSALLGLNVVIRQSLIDGNYSLLTPNLHPLPDYWISLFYKKLVGQRVLNVKFAEHPKRTLRFYAHCMNKLPETEGHQGIVLFGMNLAYEEETFIIQDLKADFVYPFIFTSTQLQSKNIILNGKTLHFYQSPPVVFNPFNYTEPQIPKYRLKLSPYSLGFWVFEGISSFNVCSNKYMFQN